MTSIWSDFIAWLNSPAGIAPYTSTPVGTWLLGVAAVTLIFGLLIFIWRSFFGAPKHNYRLQLRERLGSGGLGDVYKSDCCGMWVAVKRLKPGHDEDDQARRLALFKREAKLLQELDGQGSLPKLHQSRVNFSEPVILMEYIQGPTLKASVKKEGLITDPATLGPILQNIASGLSVMHDRSAIHRDLNPANVILQPGYPRLIDLGLSKELDANLTDTFYAQGTLQYMSPEIAEGRKGTPETDVYGWGLTIAYALTGATIYHDGPQPELWNRVAKHEVDPAFFTALDQVADTGLWHRCLVSLIRTCVEKDPAGRPKDGTDLWMASVSLKEVWPTTSHTHTTFDRAVVKKVLRRMADQIPAWEDNTLEGHLADAVGRLARLYPVSAVMRRGIAPAVLHATFLAPSGPLAAGLGTARTEAFKKPAAWVEILQPAGIAVEQNKDGLLVFS